MYKFNQWLKLREVDEFGSYTPEEIAEMERIRKAGENQPPQQKTAPPQQPPQQQPFSVSTALGIKPEEVELLPFPKQNKTGFRNKKQGSPGYGRVFYIDNGLDQNAKEKFFADLRKEFGTSTPENNAPSNNQQFTQKQLDDRFVRMAYSKLQDLAQMNGDAGAESMLRKISASVLDGSLDSNMKIALINAYKNGDLNAFRKAYEASRRIR